MKKGIENMKFRYKIATKSHLIFLKKNQKVLEKWEKSVTFVNSGTTQEIKKTAHTE